jgi:hypothetical protein
MKHVRLFEAFEENIQAEEKVMITILVEIDTNDEKWRYEAIGIGKTPKEAACYALASAHEFQARDEKGPNIWRKKIKTIGSLRLANIILDKNLPHYRYKKDRVISEVAQGSIQERYFNDWDMGSYCKVTMGKTTSDESGGYLMNFERRYPIASRSYD